MHFLSVHIASSCDLAISNEPSQKPSHIDPASESYLCVLLYTSLCHFSERGLQNALFPARHLVQC